jgi:hypothetical protein
MMFYNAVAQHRPTVAAAAAAVLFRDRATVSATGSGRRAAEAVIGHDVAYVLAKQCNINSNLI